MGKAYNSVDFSSKESRVGSLRPNLDIKTSVEAENLCVNENRCDTAQQNQLGELDRVK